MKIISYANRSWIDKTVCCINGSWIDDCGNRSWIIMRELPMRSLDEKSFDEKTLDETSFDETSFDETSFDEQSLMKRPLMNRPLINSPRTRETVSVDLENVLRWAETNNLKLNTGKSREMIVARRGCGDLPPPLDDVLRVDSMHILGVTLSRDLGVTGHVNEIIEASAGSLHALRILRAHGLPPKALYTVAEATTVSKLLYAAPAWWGLASATDRHRLDRFLAKTVRMGYLPSGTATVDERVSSAEDRLFQSIVWNEATFCADSSRH
jgi:hypothetical protein